MNNKCDDADARIARAIRICVGNHLREMYGDLLNEPIPPKIADLLHRLDMARTYPQKVEDRLRAPSKARWRRPAADAIEHMDGESIPMRVSMLNPSYAEKY